MNIIGTPHVLLNNFSLDALKVLIYIYPVRGSFSHRNRRKLKFYYWKGISFQPGIEYGVLMKVKLISAENSREKLMSRTNFYSSESDI